MADQEFDTDEPIAYYITWTTYGTWLPGDQRGSWHRGQYQSPHELFRQMAAAEMKETAFTLPHEDQKYKHDARASESGKNESHESRNMSLARLDRRPLPRFIGPSPSTHWLAPRACILTGLRHVLVTKPHALQPVRRPHRRLQTQGDVCRRCARSAEKTGNPIPASVAPSAGWRAGFARR